MAYMEDDEINLYDLFLVIKRRLWFLIVLFLVATGLTGVYSKFVLPPIYRAQASIMPLETSEGGLSSTLAALSGIAGINIPMGKRTSAQTFVAVLNSRTVAETVIQRLDLMSEFFEENWDQENKAWKDPENPPTLEDAVRRLQRMTQVSEDRNTGLVNMAVEYTDPRRAAEIANVFLEELDSFINANALSMAKRKRIFLEEQLNKNRRELRVAEERFKDFQQEKRFVAMDSQAEAAIKGMAELKGLIAAKEVELDVIRTYATSLNPKVQLLQSELKELHKQLEKLEADHSNQGGSKLSLASAPALALTYARLKREVIVHEKVMELLTQQYELARIEEAKEDVSFQIIDQAVPPVKKYKPKSRLNVMLAGVVSLMLGIFLIFFWEYIQKARAQARTHTEPENPPVRPPTE